MSKTLAELVTRKNLYVLAYAKAVGNGRPWVKKLALKAAELEGQIARLHLHHLDVQRAAVNFISQGSLFVSGGCLGAAIGAYTNAVKCKPMSKLLEFAEGEIREIRAILKGNKSCQTSKQLRSPS